MKAKRGREIMGHIFGHITCTRVKWHPVKDGGITL